MDVESDKSIDDEKAASSSSPVFASFSELVHITTADKERLAPGVELNDEIINFYLTWLQKVRIVVRHH
jgi:Ulp1 family protease